MDTDLMTIEEVADYLRMSDRTVYDWAQRGEIPGGKFGTTWRFRRSDIEEWVNSRLGAVGGMKASQGGEILARILRPDRVVLLDDCRKQSVLKTLSALLATTPEVGDEQELEHSIFAREELMSTGIGFGVGVPHVRLPSVKDLVMALGLAREPISDYESLDNAPVQIVCMLAANKSQHPQYIRALSAISRRLKDGGFRERLLASPHAQAAYELFVGTGG